MGQHRTQFPPDALAFAAFVGNRIRNEREEKQLTTFALATRAGLYPVILKRIEDGLMFPTTPHLYVIAHVLNVSVSDLLRQ